MYGVYRSTRPMGPSERAHRRCAKKSAVAGLYMGMVMMGIGWRGPLIQEGAVNRALTSYVTWRFSYTMVVWLFAFTLTFWNSKKNEF